VILGSGDAASRAVQACHSYQRNYQGHFTTAHDRTWMATHVPDRPQQSRTDLG